MSRLFSKNFILLLAVVFLLSLSGNMLNSPLPVFAIHIGAGNSIAGLVTGLFALSSMVCRPLFGWVLDKKGRRIVLLAGALVYALVTFSYNWVGLVSTLLVVRFFQGFALSAYSTAMNTMAADLIPTGQLVAGYGYFSLMQTIASSLGPVIGLQLAAGGSYSWLFTLASIVAGAGLLVVLVIDYEKAGRAYSFARFMSGGGKFRLSQLLERSAFSVTAAVFFFSFSTGVVLTFLSPYAISKGVTSIGVYFAVNAAVIFVMRLVLQKIIKQIGLVWSAVAALAFVAGSMIVLGLATSLSLFIAAAVLGGIGSGIVLPIFNSLVIRFCPDHRRGAASATYYIGIDSGIGAGSVLGGVISEALGYPALFVMATIGVVITFVIFAGWIRPQFHMAERAG